MFLCPVAPLVKKINNIDSPIKICFIWHSILTNTQYTNGYMSQKTKNENTIFKLNTAIKYIQIIIVSATRCKKKKKRRLRYCNETRNFPSGNKHLLRCVRAKANDTHTYSIDCYYTVKHYIVLMDIYKNSDICKFCYVRIPSRITVFFSTKFKQFGS